MDMENILSKFFDQSEEESVGFPDEKKYFFVFLDQLGFSNKVLKAVEDRDWIGIWAEIGILIDSSLSDTLKACQCWEGPISSVKEKRFSDSICLYWEIGDYGDSKDYYTKEEKKKLFQDILFLMSNVQMRSSIHKTLFRGGIAVGHYYEKDEILISDALVRAHNIENSIKNPVIGIDNSVWKEIDDESFHEELITQKWLVAGDNGIEYIDFIDVAFKNKNIRDNKWRSIFLNNFKKAIESNWIEAKVKTEKNGGRMSSSLKGKYSWLVNYYNKKCEKLQLAECAVGEDLLHELDIL